MAVETMPRAGQRPLLDRAIDLSRINLEVAAYLVIVALSVVAHLWGLGAMAMHHDEAIHAWSSWRFYTGQGGFTCWGGVVAPTYCYDPVYHGPSLYVLTALSYFLFGAGDAQARLPMAVAGIGLVASCWWLRPYMGRRGALIAALLLGFTPALLYFTRFARHDGLMVLWELWMVIGVFRFLDSGRPAWLYLTAASVALAIATHELYYILFFIFGIFVLMRLIAESRFANYLNIGLLVVMAICLVLMVVNPPLPVGVGLYFGEKAFLVASALALAWLCQRLWDPRPVLTDRLQQLWRHDRRTVWVALGILGGIYVLLYSTFFAYPRGAVDGLYAGLAYWLGTQQDYARGDQPWYYYLIQLPLYEPLAVTAGLGMVVFMIQAVVRRVVAERRTARSAPPPAAEQPAPLAPNPQPAEPAGDLPTIDEISAPPPAETAAGKETIDLYPADAAGSETVDLRNHPAAADAQDVVHGPWSAVRRQWASVDDFWSRATGSRSLFPLLLVFWFFTAIIIFSWAGEKMPWLLTHMALPGNLLAAWVLGRLLLLAQPAGAARAAVVATDGHAAVDQAAAQPKRGAQLALVPLVLLLILVALGVAIWRLTAPGGGQTAQANLLQGLVPLVLAGGLIYALLNIGQQLGARVTLALMGLTMAGLLGLYTLRATWMAVYAHPDVPIELLVYTQTAPDVPRYVADIRELAINLTRNQRTSEDVTGGLSMPLIIDSGGESGEGSLAWPLQWYLRDFNRIVWKSAADFRNANSLAPFEVTLPDGSTGPAPVLMLYKPHVDEQLRDVLREGYVQPYGEGGVFNWWFPEGDKCAPTSPGYKRFYFSTLTPADVLVEECGRDISNEVHPPWAVFTWPFERANWPALRNFVLYRELPYPLVPGSRPMEVWLRSDLAAGTFGSTTAPVADSAVTLRLVAQQVIGDPTTLGQPTGMAIDSQGRVYVADTANHQVLRYGADGNLEATLGGFGSGLQEFFEPRGLAVDDDDNLYVADTWNARVVKFSPEGEWLATWGSGEQDLGEGRRATITDGVPERNAAAPLGFFGPRGVAVDSAGRVYVADTGNKRIVVTDDSGNFLYQWGYAGSEPGAFNEPTSLAIDANGNVVVADTWNGRVQVFEQGPDGRVAPIPLATWDVRGWRPDTYEDPYIALGPNGLVLVSVPLQQRVTAANLRGDVVLRWGGTGEDLAALNSPSGIATGPDGSVYVADRDRGRVLRFELPQLQP